MNNYSDFQSLQQFLKNTSQPSQIQPYSSVITNNILNSIPRRRTKTLDLLPPFHYTSTKTKAMTCEKRIQTRPDIYKPKTNLITNLGILTKKNQEISSIDISSKRKLVNNITIKKRKSTIIERSPDIAQFKTQQKIVQNLKFDNQKVKEKGKFSTYPFSTDSHVYLQQFLERSKNKNNTLQRHSQFKQMEYLEIQTKDLQMILSSDILIGPVLYDAHEMKGVVKSIIDLTYGNKLQYQYETLRNIHNSLGITDEMFHRFKLIFIKKLISMKSTVEDIFRCAQTIESYRGAITCSDNSVQKIKNHLRLVTKEMYTNIWNDYTLSVLFRNAKLDEQVIKFSRIFGFILSTSETTNYVLDSMRDFHREMGITSVQYSIFKYYLSASLQTHIDVNVVWHVLEQADCYKAAVINQDSIKDLVYKTYGIENFTNDFNKACFLDHFINKYFIKNMGLEQFQIHTSYFMQYIFNKHNTCFVLQDLQSLHKGVVNSKLFKAYKCKFFQLILKLNPHRVMISDFAEDFDLLEHYITGKPLLCELIGDGLNGFLKQLCLEMKSDYEIVNLYETNEVKIEQNLKRMFNYMFSGRTYYKRSDIQAIHSRLYISEDMFMEFVSKCHRAIDASDPSLKWIIDVVMEWKELIISKK